MRALIVDDEPLARDGMRMLLAEYEDIQVVGEASNGRDALSLVEALQPDLMFVDVQMPGMNGLELASELPEQSAPTVVFVTAYDEFALRAFDVHALDYVLKPIDEQRFAEAVRRARVQHQRGAQNLRGLGEMTPRPSKLAIRDGDAIVFVPIDEIDWVEAADYYVEVHAGDRTYLMRETMQRLQTLLDDRFVRIHRSRLVNREHVREVRLDGRDMVVVMTNGVALGVARSCRAKLDLRSKIR
jgi:two-component system LytT family response regulator